MITSTRKHVQVRPIGFGEVDEIADEIAARAADHDRTDSFVAENFALLKKRGFFKAHVPAELGGYGADYPTICTVVRRLAAACGSTGLAFSMHTHIVALAAWRWRHENAPTDALLRRVAAEDLVLISSGGSDWLKSMGTAVRGVRMGSASTPERSLRAAARQGTC